MRPAPENVLQRVREIEAVCSEFGVPLKAAALQFVLAHPAIVTNIPGTRTVGHLDENIRLIAHPIPDAFWAEIRRRGLVREDAPTPGQGG